MEHNIILDKNEILQILPHRHPMVFIDGVVEITEDCILAYKDIDREDEYFKGHFPNIKIFPGVYIVEAVAQSSIILLSQFEDNYRQDYTPLLYHSDFKFKKVVHPNATLFMHVKLVRKIGFSAIVDATAKVKNEIVAEGSLTFVSKKM